jgi:A/G-specific adenine glycosylase
MTTKYRPLLTSTAYGRTGGVSKIDLLKALPKLANWFNRQQRVLPWREQPTTYRVWISEIMLQQTQVVTVIPYFEKFLSRFPTVESLAEAPLDDVLLNWAGLGYYSRARNIHKGAKLIVEKGFPRDREGWLEIPGVGEYTAGAILSIALNQPEAILDGNVERVLSRARRVGRSSGDKIYKSTLWDLSRTLVEAAHAKGIEPRVTNQALMELGATVCTFRNPKCLLCPLQDHCEAHAVGEEVQYPPKKKPKEWLNIREELFCVISPEGQVLVQMRAPGEWRAGLFDLPVEISTKGAVHIGEIESKHIVTRHKITRKTHVWRLKKTTLMAAEGLRWINPVEPEVAIGSALKKTLAQIRETFPEAWPTNSALVAASSRWD